MRAPPGEAPGRDRALEQYRRAAPGYDLHMRRLARWQRLAVDRLALRRGETVIDVACGTGLNFDLIQDAVGSGGHIVGVDLSPDMLTEARRRVEANGWTNVTLIEAAVEDADLGRGRDAALFSFTHDVLQSEAAVANVIGSLRPDARVTSAGAKLAGSFSPIVNFFVRRAARPYITTFSGLDRPWRLLEQHIGRMQHRSLALGGAYVAWGAKPR